MTLIARAYALRRGARQALRDGHFQKAHELARAAQDHCATEAGSQLLLLTRWLTH